MKIKKTVTDSVRAANKNNAQDSPGPQTEQGKANVRYNALQHGILARRVVLKTDEERAEFHELSRSCHEEWCPKGSEEKFYTEEIVILYWKLQITEGLETRELSRRQELSGNVDGVFRKSLYLPINDFDLPLDRGWDCERLVVRAVSGKTEGSSFASGGPPLVENQLPTTHRKSSNRHTGETGHLELEAVMASSLTSLTRYRSPLKRELYRAFETLRAVQSERREREEKLRLRSDDADTHRP